MSSLHINERAMRTNIVIDDELMALAMRLTGLKTKKEVVELALKELIVHKKQDKLAEAFGKFKWDGDLEAMRTD
jgi:Arc/MetJ family transcription regulator